MTSWSFDDPFRSSLSPLPTVRPQIGWPAAVIGVIVVQIVLTLIGGRSMNTVAAVLGMFASIILLGAFRISEAQRRSTGAYIDWRISAERLVSLLVLASWSVGVLNVFFVAKDLTR
jgi:hypothetical protein